MFPDGSCSSPVFVQKTSLNMRVNVDVTSSCHFARDVTKWRTRTVIDVIPASVTKALENCIIRSFIMGFVFLEYVYAILFR